MFYSNNYSIILTNSLKSKDDIITIKLRFLQTAAKHYVQTKNYYF